MELKSDRFITSDDERTMIQRMVKFICLFYSIEFLRSRISVFALANNFKFFVAINWYQKETSDIATAVILSEVTNNCAEKESSVLAIRVSVRKMKSIGNFFCKLLNNTESKINLI